MNKKDCIRKYILKGSNGLKFNAGSLAKWANDENQRKDITPKDVDNTVLPLFKGGALSRERINGVLVYTVVKNNIQLWFAKHPLTGVERKPNKPKSDAEFLGTPPRKKNRSPFVISIDAEIADLQCKIKRLNAIRKEFA